MTMPYPVYRKVRRVWLAFSARKLGGISAGSQITNLWAYERNSTRFADWCVNNDLKRSAIVVKPFFIAGNITNHRVHASATL